MEIHLTDDDRIQISRDVRSARDWQGMLDACDGAEWCEFTYASP